MRKILAIVMSLAMVLSMGVVFASAAPGVYATGEESDFEAVGKIDIQWDPNASTKIDLTDGKLDEWQTAQYTSKTISPDNMIAWENNEHTGTEDNGDGTVKHLYSNTITTNPSGDHTTRMPEGWSLQTYFVADKDNLYVGFYITDPDVVASDAHYHTGDAFQMNIDFGGKLGDIIENYPERVEDMENTQNIFYSFCYAGDGQPIRIFRDCSGDNRELNKPEDGVQGTTAATPNGWSAEFKIAWKTLYDDYEWKAWADNDAPIYVGSEEALPLKIGMALYYQDHTNVDGDPNKIVWAAGTGNGTNFGDDGKPVVTWDAHDNGINLELAPQDGLEFSYEKIVVLGADEKIPEFIPETDPPADTGNETEPADDQPADTKGEETKAEDTKAEDKGEETKAPASDKNDDKKGGCGGMIGAGAAVAVLAAAAAAVALKKKD